MISSSNFQAIARLVVLARNDPRTTSPFSSLVDPVTLTCTLFPLRAFFKKDEYKEGKFHRRIPHYELQGKSHIHRQYLLLLQFLLMFVFP